MKSKVASKFYWFIAISICLSILVSSVVVATYLLNHFEKEVLQKDELHLKGLVGNVQGFIDRCYSLNYQLSVNPIIINNLLEADKNWEKRFDTYENTYNARNRLTADSGLPIFVQMQRDYDFVELFFLQDEKGDQTARSFGSLGHRGRRWWYRKIMSDPQHTPFFSKSYYSLTGNKPVASVFHPIFHDKNIIGILGTDINFDFLQTFVVEHLYSKDLWAMITDSKGVIIAHPDNEKLKKIYNLKEMTKEVLKIDIASSVLDASGHMKTRKIPLNWDPKISALVAKAINGQSGYEKDVTLEGKSNTLYYQPVNVPGAGIENFTVILVRDQSTLFNTKISILIFVLVFTVFTILLLLLLFHIFFKRLILNPLETLTRSIRKADLEYTEPIILNTGDEFQTLAETFNHLHNNLTKAGSDLKELNEQLEQKVDLRTRELVDINQQLSNEVQDHKVTAEKLREARDIAESASKAKSQFLANISHELRTPMHGILSFVTLGLSKIEGLDRKKLKLYFGEIHSSAHRLLKLLNDLLDLSKLESGKEKYTFNHHRLSEVIDKAIGGLSALQKAKEIAIHFEKPDFDDLVEFDKGKIIQVMQNLISNAIKFSEPGGKVTIEIDQQENVLVVSIIDQGVGIPKEELQTVFDKFVQSSKTATGAGGTGLGLSICKKIITDHQGRIWAETNPAGGAIVRFQIPRVVSQ